LLAFDFLKRLLFENSIFHEIIAVADIAAVAAARTSSC
jgi:hypothetical protein